MYLPTSLPVLARRATAGLALLPLCLFLLSSCQKTIRNDAYYAAISKYVYAYTSGSIGRDDAIRVRFVNPAVGQDKIGQKIPGDLFSISPAIKGDAVWEDDRTIKLQPAEPLAYGAHYKGKVALRKLFADVPKEAKTFEFEFSVRQLDFEVVTEGLRAQDPNDLRKQQISGRVSTSDPVENAAVEKMLTAQQGNKTLSIGWVHADDRRTHQYYVNDVERSNTRSKVKLFWSGQSLGVRKEGSEEVTIPSLDEFIVMSARVIQVEEQYVQLNFSDPISTSQTLDGLISLDGVDGTLRFATDANFVRVYPASRVTGDHILRIAAGIRNTAGAAMKEGSEWPLTFEDLKPAVRLVGRGAIIPQGTNGSVIFPFEAVGLRAVDVEVFKIYNSNILQYLQVNEIEGDYELERVGKIIAQKKVSLSELNPGASDRAWQRYALDLKDIIKQDPGAIYQIRLAFRMGYVTNYCNATTETAAADKGQGGPNPSSNTDNQSSTDDGLAHLGAVDEDGNIVSIWGDYRGIYFSENDVVYNEEGEEEGYSWDQRDNPCRREYYNYEHFTKRNVFVSDLGLTAKRGQDGTVFVAATDLHSTDPVSGVDLELYNYQLQPIGKGSTGSDGTVLLEDIREKPFVIVAHKSDRRGYLRMADGNTLSLSRFDVAGVEPQKGLKGYLYGERGVWRPGDSLFLNFVLEDKIGNLPAGHPITLELTDPRGALQFRTVSSQSVGGVYPLHCATRTDAPTGNWTAKVMVGSATFTKNLKIETVKPNRLKMELDFGKKELSAGDENLTGKLQANWLHGAVAKNLKAKVEMQVNAAKTEFKDFKDFVFDDPARSFNSDPQVLFESNLNDNGQASVPLKIQANEAPGKLIANFKVRVFEQGGDFSTDNFALDYYPYERFVGVSIPKNQWGAAEVDREKGAQIQFVCVDKRGRPMPNQTIQVGLYRTDWRWWWDENSYDNVAQFNSATHINALDKATLKTDGRGLASWKVRPGQWGRYLVRVADEEGGHAAGAFFWSGYPQDAQDMATRNAAAMLAFSVDKEKYGVGEDVTLKVPASENGRILLTLETGARVAKHIWFDAKTGDNLLKFKATEDMAPTVYAHVSLFQPHAQTKNDLPIRMYGVMPVNVENMQTHLQPKLDMPEVLEPGKPFTVSVSESSGKACAYTLAIVDEGLLDLTRFQTPNPWEAFFAREALGVKTWDIYDYVLGAYGAELERILSIGGDAINQKAKNGAQINRFKPAVVHVGPFYLKKGETAKHTLKIDNYVGSVRAMLVCSAPAPASRGAYGSAEKTCPVRKPLMILPTLPRVLGPGETLRLPIDVFAMDNKVKNATIRVKENSGLVQVQGSPTNTVNFSQPGEEMTYFNLKVGQKTGAAKFTITAQGGGETAEETIELWVRNPNPVITNVWEGTLEPGKEWTGQFDPARYSDIANAVLEVSALPPMNLSRHLEYLIQYPHGCVEQTTSAAFPQLYVDLLTPLSQKQKDAITRNVTAAIGKLGNFQDYSGGFSYWPGGGYVNDWSSSYAGHFLLEAKNKGYAVPEQMLNRWLDYQAKVARQWSALAAKQPWEVFDNELNQAYRLYTLALGGKSDIAGMNRLKEKKDLYSQAAYLLAAAYAQSGKPEAAREIANGKWKDDFRYDWCGYTYGSDLRDRSLILETYTAIGDQTRAQAMVDYIANEIGSGQEQWYWTTQSLSTALRALSKYVSKNFANNGPSYAYQIGGSGMKNGDSSKPISTANFTEQAASSGRITVQNKGGAKLYARLIVSGQPVIDDRQSQSSNIVVAINYVDAKGKAVDVARLPQGTDFVAEVTVKRSSQLSFPFTELALSQVFPSGWEILNSRMNGVSVGGSSPADYQDVRDDRVFTYFDIGTANGETRTYRIQLNAAYAGRYYLPTVSCEAMYDQRIRASAAGKWVEVI